MFQLDHVDKCLKNIEGNKILLIKMYLSCIRGKKYRELPTNPNSGSKVTNNVDTSVNAVKCDNQKNIRFKVPRSKFRIVPRELNR